ncbi:hypothetical protein N752_00400 [Desulforamulus aquiferis]|nr:lipid II flippase MurJ [Desulforamulus aquiferis]RYD07075.1 hypothetical protein N752_00400 [Desulforamulus aquiferis]
MTAIALLFYSIGLVGQAANIILTRGFYALQDTKTPVKLMGVTVVVNVILSLLFIGPLAHGGLALANSLASLLNTVMLSWYLNKRIPGMWDAGIFKFFGQVAAASAAMAAGAWGVSYYASGLLAGLGTLGLALQVGAGIAAGVAIFLVAVFILKMEEAVLVSSYANKLFNAWVHPGAS